MKKKPSVRRRPKTAGTPTSQLHSAASWVLTRLPLQEAIPAAAARRRAAAGEAPGAALPEAMTKGDFEVLDVVEATPSAARRGAGDTELPLRATVPADASVLLALWRKPDQDFVGD